MYYLQFLDDRIGGVWEPNWSGVHEDGVNKCFVGGNDGLLLLAPVGTSEGLQDGESLFGFLFHSFHVFVEAEMRVERDTQDLRVSVQRQQGTIERDQRVEATLLRL